MERLERQMLRFATCGRAVGLVGVEVRFDNSATMGGVLDEKLVSKLLASG